VRLAPERDDAAAPIASADRKTRPIDEHGLEANERPRDRHDAKMR
jgi:hypothetical protein